MIYTMIYIMVYTIWLYHMVYFICLMEYTIQSGIYHEATFQMNSMSQAAPVPVSRLGLGVSDSRAELQPGITTSPINDANFMILGLRVEFLGPRPAGGRRVQAGPAPAARPGTVTA
jgi:hypothetical protein